MHNLGGKYSLTTVKGTSQDLLKRNGPSSKFEPRVCAKNGWFVNNSKTNILLYNNTYRNEQNVNFTALFAGMKVRMSNCRSWGLNNRPLCLTSSTSFPHL